MRAVRFPLILLWIGCGSSASSEQEAVSAPPTAAPARVPEPVPPIRPAPSEESLGTPVDPPPVEPLTIPHPAEFDRAETESSE